MDTFYDQIRKFSDVGAVLDPVSAAACLLSALALSVVVAKTYQFTYRGPSYSPAFMHTLVICGMVIAAVMLVIGSNIARAFSLVGALSIIRFRNAVKDPRDVAFIFLVMGVGMGCGTGFYAVAVVLTAITCAATSVLSLVGFGERSTTDRIVKIETPVADGYEKAFDDVLSLRTRRHSLVSVETSRTGTEAELTFAVEVDRKFSPEALVRDVTALNRNLRVRVLGTETAYDL